MKAGHKLKGARGNARWQTQEAEGLRRRSGVAVMAIMNLERERIASIAEWRELGRRDPRAAAAEWRYRLRTRLTEAQRRAVWATEAEEEALAAAIAAGGRGGIHANDVLAGVPFAVKDLYDVAGWPTRAGSRFLAEERGLAPQDSALVAALRAAGAVPVGKTHLHEFAYGVTGENPHYGDCEHPAFPGRTTGGSSSGSAAAVASGIVPFALGTDTGGSVRVPAAFCGLYGYRLTPSHAWIRDAFPLAPCCDTPGWFTQSASDMRLLNAALIGARAMGRTSRTPRGCFLQFGRLEDETAAACRAKAGRWAPEAEPDTAERLRAAFSETLEAYLVLTGAEAAEHHAPWLERHKADYSDAVWQRLDRGRRRTTEELLQAEVRRRTVSDTLKAYFLTFDFLVLPAVPCPALTKTECDQEHRERILELNAPASLAGLPALTVPVPLRSGLTAGLQIVVPYAESPVVDWILESEAAIKV